MVEIENLSLSYGNSPKVLKNISLDVKKGECVLFTGKSGSGKSSIIRNIALSIKCISKSKDTLFQYKYYSWITSLFGEYRTFKKTNGWKTKWYVGFVSDRTSFK